MKREFMDLEDGEIVEDEFGKDVREAIRDSIASHKRISYHDQSAVSGSIRSNGSSRMPEKRRNQDASVENEGRPVDDRLRILRLFEKEKSGKRVEMNIANENKTSIEVCNDQKGIDKDIERTEKANKVEHHEQISEIPDDEWIFESLGETQEAITRQCPSKPIDDIAIRRLELEKERQKLLEDRKKMEETFARDKKQLAANLYTLLVTARHQINMLNADKQSLTDKLEANCAVKCPSCGHFFSMTKNLLRPKHIHVTKGTNAVELRFENFDMLRRWLNLNNLDHGVDGLPVWLEPESEAVTLASTNSSITAAINAQSAQQRKLVDVTKSISNTKTHSKNAPVTTAKPALHECRSVTAPEARRHNLASGDSAERRRMKAKVTEKCDAHECSRPATSKANSDRDRGSAFLQDRRVSRHVVDTRRRLCGRIEKRSRSPISGRNFFSTGRDKRKRHVDR